MPHEPQRLASTYSKSTSKQTIRLRQLETQYESQLLLINQTQLQQAKINSLHELLADGICQQRLLYELLVPLHQQWLRNDDSVASISSWCAADDNSRGELVDMVASCNPIVAALLKATPQQVREAAALTLQELISVHTQVFRELLVLLELLSPSRYRGGGEVREDDAGGQAGDMQVVEDTDTPGEAAPAAAASQETADTQQASAHHSPQAAAAATGSGSMPGLLGLEGAVDPAATFAADEQAAAAAAEERLSQLIEQYNLLGGLLILHNPSVVMQVCCYNLSTGQPCVAPLLHFVHAAKRIGFSAQQLELLRLMLQQYNRTMSRQVQEGRELSRLVEHSAGVQVLAAMAETQGAAAAPPAASAAGAAGGGRLGRSNGRLNKRAPPANKQRDDRAVCDTSCNDQQQEQQEQQQEQGQLTQEQQDKSPSAASEAAAADSVGSGLGAEGIARRLQEHVAARMDVTQLMSFWVGNTMSTCQMATFIVASWPYYPMAPALAEAAEAARPAAGTTTGGCCGCAVDMSADGAHVGVGAERHMQWRRRGMCAELTWLLEHQHQHASSPS